MENQVLNLLVEIKNDMQEMKKEMTGMKQEITGLNQEISGIKQEMKVGFEAVNTRLDRVEEKLDGIGYQFEQQTAYTTETVATIDTKTAYLLEKSQSHDIELHRIKQKINV